MLHRSGLELCSIRGSTTLTQLGHPKQKVAMVGRKEQKERSYPESNRGRPDVLHHEVMSIRTGSDNRYTIEPLYWMSAGAHVKIIYHGNFILARINQIMRTYPASSPEESSLLMVFGCN